MIHSSSRRPRLSLLQSVGVPRSRATLGRRALWLVLAAGTVLLHGVHDWSNDAVYWGLYGAGAGLAATGGVLVGLQVGAVRTPAGSGAGGVAAVGWRF